MGYLDQDGLTYLWQKIKTALAGKQDAINPGGGLSKDGDTLSVETPVRGIYTQEEWSSLPNLEKTKGFYIITDVSYPKTWISPGMTSDTTPEPYVASGSTNASNFGSTGYYGAFDGDPYTFWSPGISGTEWISFDFGRLTKLYGFSMQARDNGGVVSKQLPVQFNVEVSVDNISYTTIMSKSGLPGAGASEVREYVFDAPVDARYFKLSNLLGADTANGPKYISIADIQFLVEDRSNPIGFIRFSISGEEIEIPYGN